MGCAPSTPAATGATNLNQAIPDQFETFGACTLRAVVVVMAWLATKRD